MQFDITHSTTMALVDLMERCRFVSAATETVATGHFTLLTFIKGFRTYITLSERRGLEVKKLHSRTYKWKFEANTSAVTYLLKYILDLTIQGQGFGLRIFSFKISRPRNSSGSSEIIHSTRTPWSSG